MGRGIGPRSLSLLLHPYIIHSSGLVVFQCLYALNRVFIQNAYTIVDFLLLREAIPEVWALKTL